MLSIIRRDDNLKIPCVYILQCVYILGTLSQWDKIRKKCNSFREVQKAKINFIEICLNVTDLLSSNGLTEWRRRKNSWNHSIIETLFLRYFYIFLDQCSTTIYYFRICRTCPFTTKTNLQGIFPMIGLGKYFLIICKS